MIVTDAVRSYLAETRPDPDALLAEMQERGARDKVPILDPQAATLLHVLARAIGARRIVEVGTAIGVSTLHLARALPDDGELISFEIDRERHTAAQSYFSRARLAAKVDLRLQDAAEGIAELTGPFDLAFLDGLKAEYTGHLDLIVPLMRPGGLIAVDNVLMSGAVAEGRPIDGWSGDRVATARAFNDHLLSHPDLLGTITPVGDGIALAVRR
ncbi:O-methyltransferase [Conexibacter woesei]|uniref:O-methyltransferase family 3 n=1 Tax=Conexibacter woesei (strain DSM 14684 / CCUG 47730 / CIP 108061 / JCM 11494 / NBRC 100937 / ID131577) TaxID=469383 RepID=D3FCV8_CONWI|nr:O-methyltransferase [Conexibacter woesei]ADB51470.1 O-methyltransferase family 3 [Conexibacter woesei DSM 14684]